MGEGDLVEGRYLLRRLLGSGSVGVVYEAQDVKLGRRVALKILTEIAAPDDGGGAGLVRFHREAEALTRLHHPGVVTLHDSGVHQNKPYLVMQFLDGMNLAQLVEASGPLSAAEAAWVGLGMADALRAVHAAGVLHRDLKPSNVGVTSGGEVVLLDFGLAQLVGEAGITAAGERVGTPQFMAPEVMAGGVPSRAGDLYSLGACLHLMATGELPLGDRADLGAVMVQALGDGIPRLSGANPGYPGRLNELIDSLCAKDPGARPLSAAAVASALPPLVDSGRHALARRMRNQIRDSAVEVAFAQAPPPLYEPPVARAAAGDPTPVAPEDTGPEPLRQLDSHATAGEADAAFDSHEDAGPEGSGQAGPPVRAPGRLRPVTLSIGFRHTVMSAMDEQKAVSRLREAVNLALANQLQEASQMLAVLSSVCTSALGAGHPTTLTAQYWQGVCLARLGAGAQAVDTFARVNAAVDQRKESSGA
ncbi:protein kinase [Streptomyces sp. NPDC002138]|uniref:serine/threonine-protein kinase n=1 Tax=Streptomyces sp. NPDC002138 TaxID=3154410 RepID=UPI00331B2D01